MEAGIVARGCDATGWHALVRRSPLVGSQTDCWAAVSTGEAEMSSPEQVHDDAEDTGSDDEEAPSRCVQCCEMCGFVRAACAELCRLFCWPPVPSRIASKLAFVPPSPHYGALNTTQP